MTEVMNRAQGLQNEIIRLGAKNATLLEANVCGHRRGIIDARELARMETLEQAKQWLDWSTRFNDTIMARGHPAARFVLDAVEAMVEKDAGAEAGAVVARASGRDMWNQQRITDEIWLSWANDLYYVLEDMTKGDATVIVRNSVCVNDRTPQDFVRGDT